MNLFFEQIHYNCNGISAPFHGLIFRDPDEGRMLAIVFDKKHQVVVFNLDKLAWGYLTSGVISWQADRYEPHLRTAIAASQSQEV